MSIHVTAEQNFFVGQPTVVEGPAPDGPFLAVFEDDETTGYFYAVDTSKKAQPIQDALQIYNVANVTDRAQPSVVKIGWSLDSLKVALLINGYPHAVFDFSSKQGYCRTGFPPAALESAWGTHGHGWRDEAIQLFA